MTFGRSAPACDRCGPAFPCEWCGQQIDHDWVHACAQESWVDPFLDPPQWWHDRCWSALQRSLEPFSGGVI